MALDAANKGGYTVWTPPYTEEKRQGYLVDIYGRKTRNVIVRAITDVILPCGVFVAKTGESMGAYNKVGMPTAAGAKILGMATFQRGFTHDWDDVNKYMTYRPGQLVAYATEGDYWMYSETTAEVNDNVFFRHTANAGLNRIGAIANAAGTGLDAAPIHIRYLEKLTAPGLVAVKLGF